MNTVRLSKVKLEENVGVSICVRAMIKSMEAKQTKTGSNYLNFDIQDKKSTYNVKWFGVTDEIAGDKKSIEDMIGKVFDIEIEVKTYNGGVSLVCKKMECTDECSDDYMDGAGIDESKKTVARLKQFIENMSNDRVYKRICKETLNKFEDKLVTYPAAVKMHHACVGGWALHTVKMLETAYVVARVYERLDKELLYSGVILHDIGKLIEYDVKILGATATVTPEGALFGHPVMDVMIIEEITRDWEVTDKEKQDIMLLQHLVLSHHGKLEYGAPVIPKIPEAVVLHKLDAMDAELYQMFDVIDKGNPGDVIHGMIDVYIRE